MVDAQIKRHPIRGALYGLLIGFMLAYFVFFRFTMFGFDSLGGVVTKFVMVVLFGVVLGVVWAYVAPPKGGSAPPAAMEDPEPPAAPEEE
jgi:tetrahydromethanopterin S-methyltransferase subunit G